MMLFNLFLEKELCRSVGEVFENFDVNPLGSASIAQVQHPGVQDLMMTNICNLQAFALYMQKTDIKFDLYSVTKEMEKQIYLLNWRLERGEGSSYWGNYYPREMFGRVRASPSPSPLDSLETPPSKIIKDDSLSIYEATLMKLKLGSQRHLISPPRVTEETDCASETVPKTTSDLSSEAMNVEATCSSGTVSRSCQDISSNEEAMLIDTDCCSASVSNGSNDCRSTGNLNSQQQSESVSILYLFSKFKGDQRAPTISHEAMMIENDGSASFSSSSECQSLSSAKDQRNQESSSSSSFPLLC
ncbi:hypothetical protein CRYUN_Cryun07bG0025500 [Craigia yunnanensis]